MTVSEELSKTPLNACHRELGARLVGFAGWEMPVQYRGVIEEHRAVRTAAGLFDVSHMGEIRVHGSGALPFLERLTPNAVGRLPPGRAHYSGLLTERGTYIDDLLVYHIGDERDYLLVVNAANRETDLAWIRRQAEGEDGVTVEDVSDRYALLALQGPHAVEILGELTENNVSAIRYYGFITGRVDGHQVVLSRTGYTGEDGFEIFISPDRAAQLWRRLLAVGAARGLEPTGLGARDTLRLEAGMALYGHELDETTTPLEAGLDWVVKLDSGPFLGSEALAEQQRLGIERKLVGFEVTSRGIAREGCAVLVDGRPLGRVTSGTWSPTFEKALGMAYVPVAAAPPGTPLEIEVRGRRLAAQVVSLPFYRRSR